MERAHHFGVPVLCSAALLILVAVLVVILVVILVVVLVVILVLIVVLILVLVLLIHGYYLRRFFVLAVLPPS